MPRENSFTDSEGRSLTPDLEDVISRETQRGLPEPLQETYDYPTDNGPPYLGKINVAASAPAALNRPAESPGSPMSPRSAGGRTPATPAVENVLRPAFMTPTERFRATVRKVMAMHRTSSMMSRGGVGAEPGIDPRRASANMVYAHIKQRCVIEVVDYSTMRVSFGRMTNHEFTRMLADPSASRRDPWVRVRWINVGGLSWDVISALALKYDMHPLALEDVLHQSRNSRSKADYYPQHLFLRILCHSLSSDEADPFDTSFTELPRSDSPEPVDDESDDENATGDGVAAAGKESGGADDDERTVYGSASGSRFSTKRAGTIKRRFNAAVHGRDVESSPMERPKAARFGFSFDERKKTAMRNMKLIRELKRGDRVNVKVHPMCIFLFRDGTVVSINRDPNIGFTSPIMERLRRRDTGLRATADPSLLVQSLLDLIVDSALEVVEEYQGKILKIEQAVLLKPNVQTVRRLHIIQGDIVQHKRTLDPIKTVIYGLRRYDDDRVAALSERVDPSMKIEGYMSHKAKIYLADVHDHMEYILTSMDMFAGVSENLINYTFNMASYQMNEVMRRLTLATIIFLPLTLLTGYFGMNFENMWSIMHGHSDVVFWIIALPVMAIVVPIFMWSDLQNSAHYLQKRLIKRKLKKTYKRV
ncbi:hypothetical protein AcW1_001327 [Taiwanofungus camphoratus]|nr:hypothetical protein AcV5_005253 [Antrodia cinnamomea]KAI0962527.1 hypothetical protein AcV7_001355 [Antrodia cinnamomea]KAI0964527.1 hypothetical protein AcW1_001327 [Antrodia cinnamomea]